MDSLLRSLTQHSGEIILLLIVAFAFLFGWMIRLQVLYRSHMRRWRDLLKGERGDSLETLLYDHLRERLALEKAIGHSESRISELEEAMKTSKRYIGLVRYDAFEDVRGSQSFALAIYDDRGDGAVMTSIVGRSDCRVYCKPLVSGISERTLSQEEQRSIREAKNNGPRSIVTP